MQSVDDFSNNARLAAYLKPDKALFLDYLAKPGDKIFREEMRHAERYSDLDIDVLESKLSRLNVLGNWFLEDNIRVPSALVKLIDDISRFVSADFKRLRSEDRVDDYTKEKLAAIVDAHEGLYSLVADMHVFHPYNIPGVCSIDEFDRLHSFVRYVAKIKANKSKKRGEDDYLIPEELVACALFSMKVGKPVCIATYDRNIDRVLEAVLTEIYRTNPRQTRAVKRNGIIIFDSESGDITFDTEVWKPLKK